MLNCMNCVYAEPRVMSGDDALVHECRRYPRQLVWDGEAVLQSHPQVDETDWCGEFTPKEEV